MESVEPNKSEMSEKGSLTNLLLLLGPVVMLAGLSLANVSRSDIIEGGAQSADYYRAPGCTPTAVASSGLPPCYMQTMTVTAKNWTDGDDLPDTYKLGLCPPGGAGQEVTLVGPSKADLFNAVAVGGSVQAKIWQGDILVLSIPGWHCGTPDHPDVQLSRGKKSLAAGGAFALLGGIGTIYGWRAYKKRQPPKTLEESN